MMRVDLFDYMEVLKRAVSRLDTRLRQLSGFRIAQSGADPPGGTTRRSMSLLKKSS